MKTLSPNTLFRWLGMDHRQVLALCAALLVMMLGALATVQLIQNRYQAVLENSLQTVLDSMDRALHIWARDHRLAALNLAQSVPMRKTVKTLLDEIPDREHLIASPAQTALRQQFQLRLQSGQYRGFFVIGPNNINLASSRDAHIGDPNPLTEQPDILDRLWSGQAVVSRIQFSDIPLAEQAADHAQQHDETLFVGAPIKNTEGATIALLTLRIDPHLSLLQLLEQGRLGKTGETYAFDRTGLLLTNSRYEKDLIRMGLLEPGQHSALRIRLTNPGVNLMAAGAPRAMPGRRPLVQAVASAIQGYSSFNLSDYRDYRGVPVVGVWKWHDNLGIGLTTKQDLSEAYDIYFLVRTLIYSGAVVASLLLLTLAYVFSQGRRQVREAQDRLKMVVESTLDGIVVIDERGRIESVNPAIERLFGYPQQTLIGNNVSMLMPEPYRSEHDHYLERYRETGEARIIGVGLEVAGQRADGSCFPIELSVNRVDLDIGLHFAGIIRDITTRKQADEDLEEERRFTRQVVDSLTTIITVLNEAGNIIFINQAWRSLAMENDFSNPDMGLGWNYLQIAADSKGPWSDQAPLVAEKLHAILAGELDTFSLEYPCHSPWEQRWFQMTATGFRYRDQLMAVLSHSNITDRILAEEKMKQEKEAAQAANRVLELTQTTLEHTGIAEFWVNARDGRIIRASEQACRHLGYTRDELLRLRVPDFDTAYPADQFEQLIAPVREQGWGRFESMHLTQDGRQVPVEVTAMHRPAEQQDEEDIFVAFAIDITERKQAEAELIRARKEAETANRAKSTFLATMSHEIRTPLNGVVGAIDVLGHTSLAQNQRDLIRTARDSSLMLMSIIDDILDFSKIEAGRLELERAPLSLQTLVEEVGEALQSMAQSKNVELLLYCDPALPEVWGDPVRLRQILFNLTGNAIKFSTDIPDRSGQVVVSATLRSRETRKTHFHLQVRDNGIGMSREVQQNLFHPFVQAESSTTRRFGGTGLGLVISRRLVEMMGGHIELQSAENEGAVFSLFLNLDTEADAIARSGAELQGLQVLLVAKEEPAARILESYLRHAGAAVTVTNADETVDRCKQLPFASEGLIVAIDSQGGKTITQRLCQRLRNEVGECRPRFVLIGRGQRRYARRYGDDSLALDLNAMRRATLVNAVAAVVGRESPDVAEQAQQEPPTGPILSRDEAQAAGRLVLLADDNKINLEVIRHQLRMLGCAADVAEDGREALEKWRNGCYALLLTDCHMPEMDGYELARAIRSEEGSGQRIPIIAITADAMKGTAEKCLATGMDDYLSKPMQSHQLRDMLDKWLPKTTRPTTHLPDPLQATHQDEAVDPEALGDLLGIEDPTQLIHYYFDFLNESIQIVEQIQTASTAGDTIKTGMLAHKLKSSARTVGAFVLADCCVAIEQAGKAEDREKVRLQMDRFTVLFQQVREWIKNYQMTLSDADQE